MCDVAHSEVKRYAHSHAETLMESPDTAPTKQTPAIRDVMHSDVENWRLVCADDFYVLRTLQRAEAEIRSALYDATCHLNISKDVPPAYRQMFYDCRADGRKNPSRDRFRIVQAFRECRHVIPTETARRCLARIDRVEAEIDALVGPCDRGPGGLSADDTPATPLAPQGQTCGVILGSHDLTGWHQWEKSAA